MDAAWAIGGIGALFTGIGVGTFANMNNTSGGILFGFGVSAITLAAFFAVAIGRGQ